MLFASPRGAITIDLDYLRELEQRGFEIDYTQSLDELTEERISGYDVLVLFATPAAEQVHAGIVVPADRERAFIQQVVRYVESGGGLLLLPGEMNVRKQRLDGLTQQWGAALPAEFVTESDPQRRGALAHGSYAVELAYTDAIAKSPLTQSVQGIWYPVRPAYFAGFTLPLVLDDTWTVLVRGSSSSISQLVQLDNAQDLAPGTLVRSRPERAPALFAVRNVARGRIALSAQWPQFSVVAGTKWIYDRAVLEKGLQGRPSDYGRLLENTMRWLGSAAASGRPRRRVASHLLAAPNDARDVREPYKAVPVSYDSRALGQVALPAGMRVYRGMLGPRTRRSGGRGDVAEYARAARAAKLDFVVFLERFEELDEAELRDLERECEQHSGSDLLLLPGFSAESNLGNRLFFYGPHPAWPPANVLAGPSRKRLMVQAEQPDGTFAGPPTPYLDWILATYHRDQQQVGYYAFKSAPGGERIHDTRLSSMVGVRYYRHGKLVEEDFEGYLRTAAGTMAPTPVAIHEVDSPEALHAQARARRGLTSVYAASLLLSAREGVYQRGLRWASSYDAMPTFVSSGPQVLDWRGCFRAHTLGAEGFVPERSVMRLPLAVDSEVGLRELRLFDGMTMVRRIEGAGQRQYRGELVLDGNLQRNLVLVATDRQGGTAITAAARSWTEGASAPVFCSDHINDCGTMLLARGPWPMRMSEALALPEHRAGVTWDGGPRGLVSALGTQDTLPEVFIPGKSYTAWRLDPIPLLDFSDEGSVGVSALRREAFDETLTQVVSPWATHGPITRQMPPFTNTQHYRQWLPQSEGPPPYGWAGTGVRTAGTATLFSSQLELQRELEIHRTRWAFFHRQPGAMLAVVRRNGGADVVDLEAASIAPLRVDVGDAIGVFGRRPMNAHLLINRASPLRLEFSGWVEITHERPVGAAKRGENFKFELATLAFPIEPAISNAAELIAAFQYLHGHAVVEVLRGARVPSPGLIDVQVQDGAVEVVAPKSPFQVVLPMRVLGLNPLWSAGLLLKEGHLAGFYGSSSGRYRALSIDREGLAYVPLDATRGTTRVLTGHPIVADGAGRELVIQVTCLGGSPLRWHVSVNNPTERSIKTSLRQSMALPGLGFATRALVVRPGQLINLQ